MNVSAYILANKSQEVPVPTPAEPVEVTITPSGISFSYEMFNGATTQSVTETRTMNEMMNQSTSGEYYASQGYDCPTCNVGTNNNGTVVSLRPSSALSNIYTELHVLTTSASFSVDVSGLDAGKYVFEVMHWIGYDDKIYTHDVSGYPSYGQPDAVVQVAGNAGRVIKNGAHGVIEGLVYPDEVIYTGADVNPYQSPYYRGRVISARIRYAFEVASGDTTKTFAWGSTADISLTDLWSYVKMFENDIFMSHSSSVANCHFSLRAKVYTAR